MSLVFPYRGPIAIPGNVCAEPITGRQSSPQKPPILRLRTQDFLSRPSSTLPSLFLRPPSLSAFLFTTTCAAASPSSLPPTSPLQLPPPHPAISPLSLPPLALPAAATMGFVEDELKQLKDVLGNLDARIKKLEVRATGYAPSTDEIRMILIGPPGAGMSPATRFLPFDGSQSSLTSLFPQARGPRPPRSRSAFPAATWYVNSRCERPSIARSLQPVSNPSLAGHR